MTKTKSHTFLQKNDERRGKNGDRRSKNGFFAIFGAKYIKNYFFANFGATNEYTSTWQKQNPILFCKKTTKDAKKPTIDGPKTDILLFSGPNILKNYFLANFGATNEYTSTWQKQNPILFCNKTTKDAKKPTIDGPKTDFSMKNWDFSGSPYWRKKKKVHPKSWHLTHSRLSWNKTTKDAEKTTIDGPKTVFYCYKHNLSIRYI